MTGTTAVPRESPRMAELRRLVALAIGPVLARYKLGQPLATQIEDRGACVRVRLIFTRRIPGYLADDLKSAVFRALEPVTRYPLANAVGVVVGRRASRW